MGALVCTKRIITIEISESNGISVHENGRTTGQLGWDEMLGHIAAMTIDPLRARPIGLFKMKTPFGWEEEARQRQEDYERMTREVIF